MRVQFVAREGPERLVTEAEVHFEEGPLAGAKLVGFCLWKSPDGEVAFCVVPFHPRSKSLRPQTELFRLYFRTLDCCSFLQRGQQ